MRRREFINLLGGMVAAWPLAARAQQPAKPVIGWRSTRSADDSMHVLDNFRQGLSEQGYVDGQNVSIEFRWAQGNYDRLRGLAAELVHRPVPVLAAIGGDPPARAAKAATSSIPLVFSLGADPVEGCLGSSLGRH